MDVVSLFLIIAAVITAGLGFVLLYHGKRGEVAFVYAVNIVMILWWIWSMYFYRASSPDTIVLWTRSLYISASFIAGSFLIFSYFFPSPEKNVFIPFKLATVFIINSIVALLVGFTDLIILDATVQRASENSISFGSLYILYVLFILWGFLYGFFRLFKKWRVSDNRADRSRIVWLFSGYFVGANIAFGTNLLAPWFGYFTLNWAGQLTSIIMVSCATYAILRYRLFDVRVIAAEVMTFSLWLFLIIRTLLSETLREQMLEGGLLIVTVVVGILLVRSVVHEVEQKEEIEKLAGELSRANNRLRELDQLKSEFLSIASHQMRSPLTAIKGYSSLLMEGSYGKLGKSAQEAVHRIFQSTQTMIAEVEDFLNISRIEQGRMEYHFTKGDLFDLVQEVVNEQKPSIEAANLSYHLYHDDKSAYHALFDKEKLKQVLMNLVDNAIKYTKKGAITISVEKKVAEQQTNHDAIRVTVKDSGVGMNDEDLNRLFKKFSRAKDANKTNTHGTGLGLYIAYEIVKAHKGGKVWAESKGKGHGSSFIVEIEAAD